MSRSVWVDSCDDYLLYSLMKFFIGGLGVTLSLASSMVEHLITLKISSLRGLQCSAHLRLFQ